jgi:hypothetical protein
MSSAAVVVNGKTVVVVNGKRDGLSTEHSTQTQQLALHSKRFTRLLADNFIMMATHTPTTIYRG